MQTTVYFVKYNFADNENNGRTMIPLSDKVLVEVSGRQVHCRATSKRVFFVFPLLV